MFKYSVSLKQHTPLIHFHKQPGATLRATELKPKLDKYLIKNCEIRKEWITSGQEDALDYKVRVIAPAVDSIPIAKGEQTPAFFGNMGDEYDDNPKCFSIASKPLKLSFSSFHSELVKQVETCLGEFFARHNFGTRQSKGYGSFTTEIFSPELYNTMTSLRVGKRQIRDFRDLMNIINYYYQRLRSGINYRHEYQHAFLKMYLEGKGYHWEKRWLKEKFIGGLPPRDEEERFARAMLGLGGAYTFKPKHRDRRDGQVYPDREVNVNVESTTTRVSRFKSPVTFKPVEFGTHWSIFILPQWVPEEMESVRFKFSARGDSHYLETPAKALDIEDLIRSYHIHLGRGFRASTYTGNPAYQVQIHH